MMIAPACRNLWTAVESSSRPPVGKDAGARRRRGAALSVEVLDGDGDAVQRAVIHARAEQGVRRPCLSHRVLTMHQHVAVDGGFKAFDAFKKGERDLLA